MGPFAIALLEIVERAEGSSRNKDEEYLPKESLLYRGLTVTEDDIKLYEQLAAGTKASDR